MTGRAKYILLQTREGVKVVELSSIRELLFKETPDRLCSHYENRKLLRYNLEYDKRPQQPPLVGMVYLQKGFRWIPSYKIELGRQRDGTRDLAGDAD